MTPAAGGEKSPSIGEHTLAERPVAERERQASGASADVVAQEFALTASSSRSHAELILARVGVKFQQLLPIVAGVGESEGALRGDERSLASKSLAHPTSSSMYHGELNFEI
jgi:hypothetical protein